MSLGYVDRTWFLLPENPIIPPIEWDQRFQDPEKYEWLIQALMTSRYAIERYTGRIERRKIWFFHIMLATLGQVNYLIMPPGGIWVEKWEEQKWHVKNFHPLVVETAERNHARLVAIINFSPGKGGHISMMEDIERAGYRRAGVNMRRWFAVLNHGNDSKVYPELSSIWFKQI